MNSAEAKGARSGMPRRRLAPAKINVMLAVTGRRPDGYHDLVSVVTPLAWGDELRAEPAADGAVEFECDDPAVPGGSDNLVVKAAAAFRAATGWSGGVRFRLTKRVPMGAGLGGGSSDAAAALVLMNELLPAPLPMEELSRVAATVGSDCPLFLAEGPVVMRGRGERIEPLPPALCARLSGRRVLLFKPAFGVSTPWAYGRLAGMARKRRETVRATESAEAAAAGAGTEFQGPGANAGAVERSSLGTSGVAIRPAREAAGTPPPQGACAASAGDNTGGYEEARAAEDRIRRWAEAGRQIEEFLFNSLEAPVFGKYPALPLLLERLHERFGIDGRMSGSGSACFAFVPEGKAVRLEEVAPLVRECWGPSAWVLDTAVPIWS